VKAQWQNVAPFQISTGGHNRGAISFSHGVLWIGAEQYYKSTDSGATWANVPTPPGMGAANDVRFLDRFNGIVATSLGTFITNDAGQSWRLVDTISANSACLVSLPNIIAIGGVGLDNIRVSTDGGISWNTSFLPNWAGVLKLTSLPDGTILALAGDQIVGGHVYASTDYGLSWQPRTGTLDHDSWDFTVDSCDKNRLYTASDDALGPTIPSSRFFTTSDAGSTWQVQLTGSIPFLCGSMALARNAAYTQTVTNGILRSTDLGTTWKPVGGPSNRIDTRMLAAIDNNILVAVDSDGNIWRTLNAGGDTVLSVANLPSSLLFQDSVSICGSGSIVLRLFSATCAPVALAKAILVGSDFTYFTATNAADSVVIVFAPKNPRAYSTTLLLTFQDGSTKTIPLSGYGVAPSNTITAEPSSLFTLDTLPLCGVSLRRTVTIWDGRCSIRRIVSETITGTDSSYYHIGNPGSTGISSTPDSVSIVFTPDTGRTFIAQLTITLEDSAHITIPLMGSGNPLQNTFRILPKSLFAGDSISLCQSSGILRSLILKDSICGLKQIIGLQIHGADSAHYRVLTIFQDLIGATTDSIRLQFLPDSLRSYSATLEIIFNDSSTILVPMYGKGAPDREPVHLAPTNLYYGDTVAACSSPTISLTIADTSCPQRKLVSEQIIGSDSLFFLITRPFLSQLPLNPDTSEIAFSPNGSRNYNASILLVFDDSSKQTVPILGGAKKSQSLILEGGSITDDTIGGTVYVPIYVTPKPLTGNIALNLHFDTSMLIYRGTYFAGNNVVDRTISQADGLASILFDEQDILSSDTVLGYAVFEVFPTYTACTTISFDSITVANAKGAVCASSNSSFTAEICSAVGCGTPTLSNLLRYNKMPALSIVPNPASEVTTIQSNVDLGEVQIELYDVLGNLVMNTSDIISPSHPASLNLSSLPSGLLWIHIQGAGIGLSQRLMHLW
jgi:photosystem II stability/assembly factor-like uncharacterized protein